MSSVGSFFSYINDARSHEPKARKVSCTAVVGTADTDITTVTTTTTTTTTSGVLRNFFRGGSTNSVEDREDGDLGAFAP